MVEMPRTKEVSTDDSDDLASKDENTVIGKTARRNKDTEKKEREREEGGVRSIRIP